MSLFINLQTSEGGPNIKKENVIKREIPKETQNKWQNIVDIIVKTAASADALITRFDPPYLDIFKASINQENIFKEGMSVELSGHYCEEVIKNDKKVMIINALKSQKWKNSPDAKAGLNAYLGYPLKWPDGNFFGTLCIHYKKSHEFSEQTQAIMFQFKELIESHLKIIDKNIEIKKDHKTIQKKEERIKEQKEELAASFEQLSAYNEELMAMNEELEQSVEQINKLNRRFVNMIELVSDIEDKTLLSEKEFFSDLLKSAIEIVPEADYGKITIVNDQNQCIFVDAVGHDIELLKSLKIDKDLLSQTEKEGVYSSEELFINIDKLSKKQKNIFYKASKSIKSSLYINIKVSDQLAGRISLDIKAESSREFSQTTKKVLETFSTVSSSFFAFKRYNSLESNFTRELTASIIKIMEMYDLYTKGHSENVAEAATRIAEKMDLSKTTVENTYWSGLVHDIGKLLIPLDILNKQDTLTENQFEMIKKHPVWGSKALADSQVLKPISKYILYHHERWDGKGYPEGLKKEEIPLISQILIVADAWDAMLSKRAYRDPLSFEEAVEEIKNNKGTQFSPRVVEAFMEIINEKEIRNNDSAVFKDETKKAKKF